MSFAAFLGQIVPWARRKVVKDGGFGAMLARLAPWRRKPVAKPQTLADSPKPVLPEVEAPDESWLSDVEFPTAPAGGDAGPPDDRPPSLGTPGVPNEDWLRSGTWLYVASSNVERIRYVWDQQILEVE